MNIDLNSFEREKAIDGTLAAEAVDLDVEHAVIAEPVKITATFSKVDGGVNLTGRLNGSVQIDCDRCVEPIMRQFDIDLDLEFVPAEQLESGADLELHSADMKLDTLERGQLDLSAIAREQILLDLPHQFFCRPECKGLCEKCGANLNLGSCECSDEEIDPRWAALKDLN